MEDPALRAQGTTSAPPRATLLQLQGRKEAFGGSLLSERCLLSRQGARAHASMRARSRALCLSLSLTHTHPSPHPTAPQGCSMKNSGGGGSNIQGLGQFGLVAAKQVGKEVKGTKAEPDYPLPEYHETGMGPFIHSIFLSFPNYWWFPPHLPKSSTND